MAIPEEQLARARMRYDELSQAFADPDVASDPTRLRDIGREQADLEPLVLAWDAFLELKGEINGAESMIAEVGDPEMVALAEEELTGLVARRKALERRIEELLVPADPNDARDVIVEIRAGAGGDEAALFASELYRMLVRYAEGRSWRVEGISTSEIGIGGLKEVIFAVRGRGAYSRLKWESGVHRVQRVPETESQGRIHTSTATVAVLPEMDEIEVEVPESDIRIDVFRSSGPGGQSVNTTDSAVRLTHLPTGIVISCQDEKSQLQNRRKALQVLRAKLFQLADDKRMAEMGEARRSQVGSGDRSEKVRTYNFPQSRVTDHRIGLTSHRLPAIMSGELDEFIDALIQADRAERLAQAQPE